jgi:hypothetical protein
MIMHYRVFHLIIIIVAIIIISNIPLLPHSNYTVYGHNFESDDNASFLTLIEKVNVEAQLVNNSLSSSSTNLTSAHEHIEEIIDLLDDIVDSDDYYTIDKGQFNNSTVNALVLANVIDEILRNYGRAFGVPSNTMLNMNNMVNMMKMVEGDDNNNRNSNSSMINHGMQSDLKISNDNNNNNSVMGNNNNNSIVNVDKFQSAQVFANRAIKIFNVELKFDALKNATGFAENLEEGLTDLKSAIDDKKSPIEIMTIAHGQVHPNLQLAYNLKLKKT